jgi:DNA repair photolyase
MKPIYESKGKAGEYAPLAVNLYRGCGHGCDYCYAPKVLRMKPDEFWSNPHPRKNVLESLRKQLDTGSFKEKQVFLSFTTDPYQPIEETERVTQQALLMFLEYGVNWKVLTKSAMACRDFNLYREGDEFGMSLTYMDIHDSSYHERQTSFPANRIKTLKAAKDFGIRTWASLEPVIEPEQTLELIRCSNEVVDHYKIGKVNYQQSDVNWKRFTLEAVELLEKMGKSYYIKDSLRVYLDE